MFGWDADGAIAFEQVLCLENEAEGLGGCLYGDGNVTLADGTVMLDNVAHNGGCICETSNFSLPTYMSALNVEI